MSKFILGLTGGIASGKSAAAKRFEVLGAAVIDTDQIARDVVQPGQPALETIMAHFGSSILKSDASLNRAVLREIIFNNPNERLWLEALLHPIIRETALNSAHQANNDLAVLVVPLLFESGHYKEIQASVVIDVPETVQRERTLSRDGVSAEQIEAILSAQMSRHDRLNNADYVIDNTGTLEQLNHRVDELFLTVTRRIEKELNHEG